MTEVFEQLREIIEQCGETRYGISKQTGIAQSILSSFMNRNRGLSQETIETLLEYLGYEIRIVKKRRTKKGV